MRSTTSFIYGIMFAGELAAKHDHVGDAQCPRNSCYYMLWAVIIVSVVNSRVQARCGIHKRLCKMLAYPRSCRTEFLRYEEQPYSISSCALVPSKPGVFIDDIQRVLVLSTKATLQLIGLSRDTATGELKMYDTDMVVETDGNEMTSIVGTTDGRVFMTGIDDGCLYELLYQAEEGWFSKRVRLENRSVGPLNRLIPGVLGTRHNGGSSLRSSFSFALF